MDKHPALCQVNTRVWLTELSEAAGRSVTLDDIPDSDLDRLKEQGFDWVWMLSVWETGAEGMRISRENRQWRKEFNETLPDLREEDIGGSGFAVRSYTVSQQLGGSEALSRLRKRLADRGMRLMLDFVPNHTAIDHPWVSQHPEYYVRGSEDDLKREPQNWIRVSHEVENMVLAHGRDPFFPGWPDTLQLNYGNPDLCRAMTGELVKIASLCDGVRCDMAMLLLPDVFRRTWGIDCSNFWTEAIGKARGKNPSFTLMAEVYWDLEWAMLQAGFDFAYDKRLYDRLKEGNASVVLDHLKADVSYQSAMVRFLENHDEQRAAAAFSPGRHEAAAIVSFLTPGMKMFHCGQTEGRLKKISPHLIRSPKEVVNTSIRNFYGMLFSLLNNETLRGGSWQLLEATPVWEGNQSHSNFIAFTRSTPDGDKYLVTVNFSGSRSQCYVKIPFSDLGTGEWILHDLINNTSYRRAGEDLQAIGLYLDEPEWKCYVFAMRQAEQSQPGNSSE